MNNFMNDLEKFGLSGMDMSNLFEDEKDENIENAVEIVKIQKESTEVEKINEEDFLFDKTIECPVCGKKFHTRMVRTSKARRIGADEDCVTIDYKLNTIENINKIRETIKHKYDFENLIILNIMRLKK